MSCPICEQALGKKPVVFQKQYFPRLPKDQAICKGCYESWPEGDVYNMLAPEEGDRKEIKRDYVALHEQKLIQRYKKVKGWVVFYLLLLIPFTVLGRSFKSLITIDIINILFWILIGWLIAADVTASRFLKLKRESMVVDTGRVTLQAQELRQRYSKLRIGGLILVSIYAVLGTIKISPGHFAINFNILQWLFIGGLLSADGAIRRLFVIGAMSPEEKEMLAEKVKPARCGICDAVQPFEVGSLRGGHFPEGVVLLKDSYPDLPHDTYVCEKCRAKHPSTKAIYDYLIRVAARQGRPES